MAIVNPGQSPAAVEKALIAELDRMKAEGVTPRELQRSKNQFARDYILGRETVQQKATHLAHAEVLHADITTADGEFDIFQNITQADVQRVAKTYFTPESRVVIHIMPKGSGVTRRGGAADEGPRDRHRARPGDPARRPRAGRAPSRLRGGPGSSRRARCSPTRSRSPRSRSRSSRTASRWCWSARTSSRP